MKKGKLSYEIPGWYKNHSGWPPIFNKGRLVFEESGHTLTNIGNYYTCSKKQKGLCSFEDEKMFEIKKLEDKINKYFSNIKLSDTDGTDLFYEVEKGNLEIQRTSFKKIINKRDNMAETLIAMEQDYNKTGKINRDDVVFLKDQFKDIMELAYPNVLLFHLKGTISNLTKFNYNNKPKYPNQSLVNLVSKVYLKNNGRIVGVKIDGLGDYLLQLIEKNNPECLEKANINILNKRTFPSLDLVKVMDYFGEKGMVDAISGTNFDSDNKKEQFFKGFFAHLKSLPPKHVIQFGYMMKDALWLNPVLFYVPSFFSFSKDAINKDKKSVLVDY